MNNYNIPGVTEQYNINPINDTLKLTFKLQTQLAVQQFSGMQIII